MTLKSPEQKNRRYKGNSPWFLNNVRSGGDVWWFQASFLRKSQESPERDCHLAILANLGMMITTYIYIFKWCSPSTFVAGFLVAKVDGSVGTAEKSF